MIKKDFESIIKKLKKEGPLGEDTLKEYEAIWKAIPNTEIFNKIDTTRAWKKIEKEIPPPSPSIHKSVIYSAAASIIVVFSLLFYHLSYNANTLTIESGRHIKEIQLPDHSHITLNRNSEISYDTAAYFQDRSVILKGEAFFSVEKGALPFSVRFKNGGLKVLGTKFNIHNNGDTTRVFVKSGKILLSNKSQSEKKTLKTNSEAVIMNDKIIAAGSPSKNVLSWKTGLLTFNQTPLNKVFKDLEKHYNVHIQYDERDLKAKNLTSSFDNQPIETVIKEIEILYSFKAEFQGQNKITISPPK